MLRPSRAIHLCTLRGLALALPLLVSTVAAAAADWNDRGIAWQSYEAGMREAARSNKPVCLIFFTDWCPHCTNYARLFHNPKVVEASKHFVMIRLNKDQHRELSGQYNVDGEYIPRTYFLTAQGKLERSLHAPRSKYKYFYPEHDPAGILAAMAAAKARLSR